MTIEYRLLIIICVFDGPSCAQVRSLVAEEQKRPFSRLFDLSGKVALVTGAAAGFGDVISTGFAEFGCDVAAADLDYNGASRTAQSVSALGRHSVAIAVDVASPEQILAMMKKTVETLGTVDILVNCAGVPQHDAAENTPVTTWDRVLDINLRGTFLCCQAAARVMLEKKKGVIINFSSIAGAVGVGRGANAYCASKGGVNTLTKQLALEWASRGIRVNAIAPCQFMTPGLKEVMADPQFDSKKLIETWTTNIPLGRVGAPEEIVGPALFLASDASSMITGIVLDVDGGYLAR
jgi:NAD(P)-dependent dehydrogenase (short-subunit alcohol dehydrogenase family)